MNSTITKTWWTRGGKRVFDVILGVKLLLLLSPLMLLTALFIKLTSPGTVFFIQERSGLKGAPFRLIKFRTMRGDRRPDPKELVPLNHPEITRLGRFLRRAKIDELPQLFNVIKGDMSLVGPRPTLPDQVEGYDALRRIRLEVRPGVTGLAQTYGSAQMPWDERIAYDIAYVRSCGLLLDLWLVVRTAAVVFMGEERAEKRFLKTQYSLFLKPSEIGQLLT